MLCQACNLDNLGNKYTCVLCENKLLSKLKAENAQLKEQNAGHIQRIEELTAELKSYKDRVNRMWGEE
jgi:hypothetical protein